MQLYVYRSLNIPTHITFRQIALCHNFTIQASTYLKSYSKQWTNKHFQNKLLCDA